MVEPVEPPRLGLVRLPVTSSLSRDHVVPEQYRLPGYDAAYDFETLIYDAVWDDHGGRVVLICPKLLNLAPIIARGRFAAGGMRLGRPRIRKFRRYDEVHVSAPRRPEVMTLDHEGLHFEMSVAPRAEDFDGLNVLVTKSRDNRLDWIEDWVRHHVTHQGTQGVLIFDNGSTAYPLDELRRRLAGIDGLQASAVVHAPVPYGNGAARKWKHLGKFFQSAVLNIARLRFFARARAALSLDVDEIVVSRTRTVYDEAVASRLGYVSIPGSWRYSRQDRDRPPRHADHIWRRDPDRSCNPKWCVVPTRRFGRADWDVHGVRRQLADRWTTSANSTLMHCEQISTGWKRDRSAHTAERLVQDERALALWGQPADP